MSLSRQDVENVALLARLRLDEKQIGRMTQQLGQVLQYVDQLGELDTDDVEPMAHAVDVTNVFRADEPREGLSRQDALVNAPKQDGECFLVPPVLGE